MGKSQSPAFTKVNSFLLTNIVHEVHMQMRQLRPHVAMAALFTFPCQPIRIFERFALTEFCFRSQKIEFFCQEQNKS